MAAKSSSRPQPKRTGQSQARPQAAGRLIDRTPIAEWAAASLGAVVTAAVLGSLIWEGITQTSQPASLSARAELPVRVGSSFVAPIVVSNSAFATAASVQVVGRLERGDQVIETRRASLAYVPGRGEAHGGLVFARDPAQYRLVIEVDGFEDP